MMSLVDEIQAFVREQTGVTADLPEDASLQDDVGLFAEDLTELIEAFATRFGVDVSAYLWYFHTGEEGCSPGGLFFPPPQDRVTTIPITVRLLREAAVTGRWPVAYPEHTLPTRRYDILVNQVLFGGGVVLLVWWFVRMLF